MAKKQTEPTLQAIKDLQTEMQAGFSSVNKRLKEMDEWFDDVDKRFVKVQRGMKFIVDRNAENDVQIKRIKRQLDCNRMK